MYIDCLLSNLIKLNTVYSSHLTIKCEELYLKNGQRKIFEESFQTKCLGVFITDISGGNSSIYQHAVDNIAVDGFTFLTTCPGNDTAFYLAIGY